MSQYRILISEPYELFARLSFNGMVRGNGDDPIGQTELILKPIEEVFVDDVKVGEINVSPRYVGDVFTKNFVLSGQCIVSGSFQLIDASEIYFLGDLTLDEDY